MQSCFCNLIRTSTKRYGFETHPFPAGFILGNSKPFLWLIITTSCSSSGMNYTSSIIFAFINSIKLNCYVSFDIISPIFCCGKYATDVYWLIIYGSYHSAAYCLRLIVSKIFGPKGGEPTWASDVWCQLTYLDIKGDNVVARRLLVQIKQKETWVSEQWLLSSPCLSAKLSCFSCTGVQKTESFTEVLCKNGNIRHQEKS